MPSSSFLLSRRTARRFQPSHPRTIILVPFHKTRGSGVSLRRPVSGPSSWFGNRVESVCGFVSVVLSRTLLFIRRIKRFTTLTPSTTRLGLYCRPTQRRDVYRFARPSSIDYKLTDSA